MESKNKPPFISLLLFVLYVSIIFNLSLIFYTFFAGFNISLFSIVLMLVLLAAAIFSILSINGLYKKNIKSIKHFIISIIPTILFFLYIYIEDLIKAEINIDSFSELVILGLIIPVGGIVLIIYSLKYKDSKDYFTS